MGKWILSDSIYPFLQAMFFKRWAIGFPRVESEPSKQCYVCICTCPLANSFRFMVSLSDAHINALVFLSLSLLSDMQPSTGHLSVLACCMLCAGSPWPQPHSNGNAMSPRLVRCLMLMKPSILGRYLVFLTQSLYPWKGRRKIPFWVFWA